MLRISEQLPERRLIGREKTEDRVSRESEQLAEYFIEIRECALEGSTLKHTLLFH